MTFKPGASIGLTYAALHESPAIGMTTLPKSTIGITANLKRLFRHLKMKEHEMFSLMSYMLTTLNYV